MPWALGLSSRSGTGGQHPGCGYNASALLMSLWPSLLLLGVVLATGAC